MLFCTMIVQSPQQLFCFPMNSWSELHFSGSNWKVLAFEFSGNNIEYVMFRAQSVNRTDQSFSSTFPVQDFWWFREKKLFVKIAPPNISFEISGRTWCYSSKIDLFITISPEIFGSKYLNITPNCAQRGNFYILSGSAILNLTISYRKWRVVKFYKFYKTPNSKRGSKIFQN